MVLLKILTLIVSIFACVWIIQHRLQIVNTVGKSELAERYLGNGGSYNMWIFIAIMIVFLAAIWLVGTPCDKKITPDDQAQTQDYYQ